MSKELEEQFDGRIGDGTGRINPNSEDFQILRETIKNKAVNLSDEERMRIQIKGLAYRMKSFLENESPESQVHAGSFLKELVLIIRIPHKVFAEYIGYKNTNLSALYSGKRRINHDLALKLGHIFEMDPELWLNLQNKAELLELSRKNEVDYRQYQLKDLLKKVG